MARKWLKVWPMVILILVIVFTSACSDSSNGVDEKDAAATEAPPSAAPAATPVVIDPMAKYDPPIELTTIRSTNVGVKFQEGESYDKNIWTQSFEQDLGIKIKNNWVVDDTQYLQKVNVSIVSGDLPDFYMVDQKQLQILIEGDQIMDLTEVYNNYASPLVKKNYEEANGLKLTGAKYKDKLYGMPRDGGSLEGAQFIWIRTDWLAKVGLTPPKTMDDVLTIAKAFTEQDPDGNGKDDTFGLNSNMNLFDGYAGLDGFFNGYHAYPYNPSNGSGAKTMWIKDASGSIVYAGIQPEVKTALAKLQEMYKAKAIYKEFNVIDGTKASELEVANKVGMHYGAFWNAAWPLADTKKLDPKADWGVYPIVSADGTPAKAAITSVVPSWYFVVNKNCKNPEAVMKLINYYLEKLYGETADEKFHVVNAGEVSYSIFSYSPISGGFAENNQDAHYAVIDALTTNDTSKLNTEQKGYFDNITKYRAGDMSLWNTERIFGPDSAYAVLGQYKKDNSFVINEFYGGTTPTMTERGSTLKDLEAQMITKIIMGEPLEAFDKFVADWKSQGGDQMTKEVNDWYNSMK